MGTTGKVALFLYESARLLFWMGVMVAALLVILAPSELFIYGVSLDLEDRLSTPTYYFYGISAILATGVWQYYWSMFFFKKMSPQSCQPD